MDYTKLTELIGRYKSGTATPEEIALLEKIWFNTKNDEAFLNDHTPAELENLKSEMYLLIKNEIDKEEVPSRKIASRPLFYKIAATILIIFAFSLWWYSFSNGVNEIRTGFGEHRMVMLPDKSKVILNGNSSLKYAAHWDANAVREVWIEGEGFFSVTHTSDNTKFIVHGASELDVEVLGTKFNIKTRRNASEVMLTEGKVRLAMGEKKDAQEIFLSPGDLATIKDKSLSTRSVRHNRYTSWMDNKLVFEHTPLRELAHVLRDTYGLTVSFENQSLEERELSGEISSATADDILYAIAETFDLRIEREGNSVTISTNNK
jgi:transmembrane sensor